ncbi:MAG: pantetheine-phosphate adenylyltransferase [Bacteroidales bacterium]|nr:pantetheine-phosphate adenylyltransferase [Bacteroidales bacterium]
MGLVACYAGSFDPVTKGHENIALRAAAMFDRLIVAVGVNSGKSSLFPLEQRLQWLKSCFRKVPQIEVVAYEGLTVDFCRRCGATVLVRGGRSIADFEQEGNVAAVNKALCPEVETVLLFTDDRLAHVSSSNVREIWRNGGDVSAFLPEGVELPPFGSVGW